jgi:hypothetical protein
MSERAEPRWTESTVDSRITKLVSSVVKPVGFKRGKWFWGRQGPLGRQEVTGGVSANYGFAMEIRFHFRVWVPEITRVRATYQLLTEKQREDTLRATALYFERGFPEIDAFRFGNFVELDRATSSIHEVVNRGLRFFEYCGSIDGIDQLLNSPGGQREFPSLVLSHRDQAVLASFLNHSDTFGEVADRVMRESHELINRDHELLAYPVETTIRSEHPLHLLVADLREGLVRDIDRDGPHPLILPPVDPIAWRELEDEHTRRWNAKRLADWHAANENRSGTLTAEGIGSVPDDNFPFGDVYETVQLSGFDSEGEPTIRVYPEGHLMVVFEFLPPEAWEMDGGDLGDFGNEMAEAIGLDMSEEQTGFFLVANPAKDTTERITTFVSTYRQTHGYNP